MSECRHDDLEDRPDAMATRLLVTRIRAEAQALGFQQLGIATAPVAGTEARLQRWLTLGWQGAMHWMARHGRRRTRPAELVPGTRTILSVRMDYRSDHDHDAWETLADGRRAYIARYALGRDYHKLMRKRLQALATRIETIIGPFGYRVFVDSAPVMEKPLAQAAGLGWIGRNTLLLNRSAGSWFFLGELYTDLPLPADTPGQDHCGSCHACLEICPTQAIVAPYRLDARRCIAYLTIEHPGSIPEDLRAPIGNRVFGCDDCQLVCPWNKFAALTREHAFSAVPDRSTGTLVDLFRWDEPRFLRETEGSAIRRLGHERWLRNLAVGLGNAPRSAAVLSALRERLDHPSALVREHVRWALGRQGSD